MSEAVEGWPFRPMAEVAEYTVGRTPARANPDFWASSGGTEPWVSISDLAPYGTVTASRERISASALESVFGGELIPAGTLLMSFKLTIGRVATLGLPAVHNEAIISIFPGDDLDQRFLGYYLSQVDYDQLQDRQIKGNTLNRSKIDRIPVPIPSLPVQEAIADLLDSIRLALSIESATHDEALLLKRSVFGEAVDRHRAPDYVGRADVVGWVTERIGDSHDLSSGGTPSRAVPEFWDGGTIPWVKTAEVNYKVISRTSEHITQRGLEESAAKILPAGTVLVAMYGQGVTRGKVGILGIDATTNQASAAIRPRNENVDPRYLYHYLAYSYEQLRQLAHGGQQQNLNLDLVRDFPLTYPRSRQAQSDLISLLDAIDTKASLHDERRIAFEELFGICLRGLMRQDISITDAARVLDNVDCTITDVAT